MRRFLLVLLLLPSICGAATYTTASVSFNDVACAVGDSGATNCKVTASPANIVSSGGSGSGFSGPADGDVILLPAGAATWTQRWITSAGISVIGAGIDQTIITDGTPSHQLLELNTTLGQSVRLSGITFAGNGGASLTTGCLVIQGTSQAVRLDHLKFNQIQNDNVFIKGWIYGVADHCTFTLIPDKTHAFLVNHDGWGGYTWGDGSWADDTYFGSNKFWFIEDCTFSNTKTGGDVDGWMGCRYVYRYNTTDGWVVVHGTESGGRQRSARAIEVYNNTFNTNVNNGNWPFAVYIRGGVALVHDNAFNSVTRIGSCAAFRLLTTFSPWGGADGVNGWDVNDTSNQAGNGYGGSTGGVYATGTCTSTSSNGHVNVATTGTWPTNHWASFVLRDLTHPTFAQIKSNTSSQITYSPTNQGPYTTFQNGDAYEIRYVTTVLDQPGMGKGDLIRGDVTPLNQTTGTAVWPNEALEYVWQWNNTLNGVANPIISNLEAQEGSVIKENQAMPGYTTYPYPHPLTLTSAAPLITSSSSVSFGTGVASCFDVTSVGTPNPTLTESGSLVSGVSFTQGTNCAGQSVGTGAGKLSGTAATVSGSPWSITFNSTNGASPDASQSFTLTITSSATKILQIFLAPSFTTLYQQQNVYFGKTYYSSIIFKNSSSSTATATGISVSNSNNEYSVPNQPATTLAPGNSVEVVIAFNPKKGVGSHSNTVTVNGDWTSGTNTVNVTATPIVTATLRHVQRRVLQHQN